MHIKKGLCKIGKYYYTRLRECVGIYRHAAVSIVLFFATCMLRYILCHMHVYSGMRTRCTVYASTKDQSDGHRESIYTGTKFTYKGPIIWAGPMVTQCMCKRTIL